MPELLCDFYGLKGSPKGVACSLLITQDGLQYISSLTEITEQSVITANGNTTIKSGGTHSPISQSKIFSSKIDEARLFSFLNVPGHLF